MFHVVLFEPEIPPNTGNAIRLCANTGATLHLVKPLGFRLDDKSLKRSGLDYHDLARCQSSCRSRRLLARARGCACHGGGDRQGTCATRISRYRAGDALLFGPETPRTARARCTRASDARTRCSFPCSRVQPQHQFIECGGARRLRGLAPARLVRLSGLARRVLRAHSLFGAHLAAHERRTAARTGLPSCMTR